MSTYLLFALEGQAVRLEVGANRHGGATMDAAGSVAAQGSAFRRVWQAIAAAVEWLPIWGRLAFAALICVAVLVMVPVALSASAAAVRLVTSAVEAGRFVTLFGYLVVGEGKEPSVARCELVVRHTGEIFAELSNEFAKAADLLQKYKEAVDRSRSDYAAFLNSARLSDSPRAYGFDSVEVALRRNMTTAAEERSAIESRISDNLQRQVTYLTQIRDVCLYPR